MRPRWQRTRLPGSYGFATEESQNAAETPQSDDNTVTRPSDAKLIYTGSLTLECTDLTAAMAGLEQLIGDYGGYLERQEVYHQTSWQTADYTVRVPSEQYHAFLGAVGTWEGGKLTYQSTTVDDVGEVYADLENRLETLQIKLDRLQALLAQAENMEDIITIESAISDVEYEIEDLSGQKNHYDSLIDYSTVYITLQQVSTLSGGVNPTLGERLSRGFTRGVGNFVEGCADFLVWLVSNLIGVVIFLGAVAPCGDSVGAPEAEKKAPQASTGAEGNGIKQKPGPGTNAGTWFLFQGRLSLSSVLGPNRSVS